MKKYCLHTNKTLHLLLKGKALEKRGEEDNRVALIKSLITQDRKVALWTHQLSVTKIGQKM